MVWTRFNLKSDESGIWWWILTNQPDQIPSLSTENLAKFNPIEVNPPHLAMF
jgi:hypothetical protein